MLKRVTKIFLILFSVWIMLCGCKQEIGGILFEKIDSELSGIQFSNDIIESDSLNYSNFPYIYMGGGIATGDINNDGLSDVFFTGNMVKNRLYLNRGDLNFEDVSVTSGIEGDSRWYTGVTMVDINSDGWLDIYVCASGKSGSRNQLYVNNKDLTFSERSEQYGVNDPGASIQSTFFDYDNDGDLDLFVGNYPIIPLSMGNQYYFEKIRANDSELSASLFRNEGNGSFVDITSESGVQNFGLTLGVIAVDFNNDGWKDLYVSNDFQVPDYLYLNNRNGTFSQVLEESVQHTSMYGMGIDASDFNNDGLMDLIQLDMAPEDYKRAKTNMGSMSPESFWEMVELGGHYQYMQNSLQLNNGMDNKGIPVFSEISRLSGLSTTDWSWGVLFADFDNNGTKDVLITNGIRRDVNNNDVNQGNKSTLNPKPIEMGDVPSQPLSNYVFQNMGGLKFNNVSAVSGLDFEGYTNGVAYADLDNDGDLDVVINNLDAKSLVFENKVDGANDYLRIKLIGSEANPLGLGTRVTLVDDGNIQVQELTLTRGFQSSVEPVLHFGLGKNEVIDQVLIDWPDGSKQTLKNVNTNQVIALEKSEDEPVEIMNFTTNPGYHFRDITKGAGIDFMHKEDQYDDFEYEPLLPHKNSEIGPGLTVGDVNNDGLEDFFIGNASGSAASLFVQKEEQTFSIMDGPWQDDLGFEDTGALLFDPDNDGDLDLYVASGGNDVTKTSSYYQDRLYINKEGKYYKTFNVLPDVIVSGQVVLSSDFDLDGDEDLFVGGRIIPGQYPYPASSYILRNDGGKDEEIRFTDVTAEIAPNFSDLGLVTTAIWDDFNNDNTPDLIIAGEWMAIRFFENTDGVFEEVTDDMGLDKTVGWWYSLKSVDIDLDGDQDIIAGNLGLNYKYQTSSKEPFEIYANDFDENGKSDIVLSYTKKGRQVPLRGKECSSEQVPAINRRFKSFESFAEADLSEIYGERPLRNALRYEANTFAHHWLENTGTGSYEMHLLPREAQFSSINAIEIINVAGDPYPDFLVGGNLYGSEVETPRSDASFGLVLEGSGELDFMPRSAVENGLVIKGEVRAIHAINLGRGDHQAYLFAISNDSLKLISKKINTDKLAYKSSDSPQNPKVKNWKVYTLLIEGTSKNPIRVSEEI